MHLVTIDAELPSVQIGGYRLSSAAQRELQRVMAGR
jgi:hypothetical protein